MQALRLPTSGRFSRCRAAPGICDGARAASSTGRVSQEAQALGEQIAQAVGPRGGRHAADAVAVLLLVLHVLPQAADYAPLVQLGR